MLSLPFALVCGLWLFWWLIHSVARVGVAMLINF